MKPKEVLFMLGLFLLVFGSLFLIPDNPVSKTRQSQGSNIDWNKVKDDPEKTYTVTWLGLPSCASGQPESWIEQNLEEVFNIELNPVFLDSNAYMKRLPLMMCNGEIPDVMWVPHSLKVRVNVRNSFVMELPPELLKKHAPNYVALVNKYCPEGWLQTHQNGRNYGIPTFYPSSTRPTIGAWRKDWLEKVGIHKTPETIEEMEEALRRFRNDDPDGNCKKDTYGYCPDLSTWAVSYTQVFLAQDLLPFDLLEMDGKVVWGGIQPGAKKALGYLRRWYAEGLIDPDYILSSQNRSVGGKFKNGKTGFVYPCYQWQSYNLDNPTSAASLIKQLNPNAEIVPGKPITSISGKRLGRCWGASAHILQFGIQLQSQPKKVIRILRMLNTIAGDEKLCLQAKMGKRGFHWDYAKDGGVELLGEFDTNSYKMQTQLLNRSGQGCHFYYPPGYLETFEGGAIKKESEFNETYKKPEWSIMNIFGRTEILPKTSHNLAKLRRLQEKTYAEIITGEKPLDYFDTFVEKWLDLGGRELLKEANQFFSTRDEIFKKMSLEVN